VNQDRVANLNADMVDGYQASELVLQTEVGSTTVGSKIPKGDASGNFTAGTITVTDIIF